jgi:hypothetical protein
MICVHQSEHQVDFFRCVFGAHADPDFEGYMGKLTDELISEWLDAGERFEMRGDGGGLYLSFKASLKTPAWLFRFRQHGEQHKLSLGHYPAMSLDDARQLAASYQRMVDDGESVIAAVGNKRVGETGKELARTFSAMLREASLHGAKRMTVTIEFEGGESWAS